MKGYYHNNRKRTKGRVKQYAPVTIGYAIVQQPDPSVNFSDQWPDIRIPILSPTIKKVIYHEPPNRR